MLKYVENKNINREKWDSLITNSINGFVYSTSDYLDIVCTGWDALIYDDYKIIMPLPFKKKLGVKYIIQPNFSQQLGIIYIEIPDQKIIDEFVVFLKNSFLYFAVNLNFDNNINGVNFIDKTNLVLDLNSSFADISNNFSKNTKRNINKSKKENFIISINHESKNFINFFVSNLSEEVPEQTINILNKLIEYSFRTGIGEIYSVLRNDKIVASVFILKSFNRYIYLVASSSKLGKELRAMFFLLNYFIENNSNSNKILDFEGSDVDGVKRFYKGFNAKEQNYKHIFKKFF